VAVTVAPICAVNLEIDARGVGPDLTGITKDVGRIGVDCVSH
jgi:hypothetical protein